MTKVCQFSESRHWLTCIDCFKTKGDLAPLCIKPMYMPMTKVCQSCSITLYLKDICLDYAEHVSTKGFANGWFTSPAPQICVQAYDKGMSGVCSISHCACNTFDQDSAKHVSSKGLVNGCFTSPAPQTYVQAYDEGMSALPYPCSSNLSAGLYDRSAVADHLKCIFAGRREYEHQVPKDQTLLHNLVAAKHKDTGEPLTDSQICAQSFTFILAGQLSFTHFVVDLATTAFGLIPLPSNQT